MEQDILTGRYFYYVTWWQDFRDATDMKYGVPVTTGVVLGRANDRYLVRYNEKDIQTLVEVSTLDEYTFCDTKEEMLKGAEDKRQKTIANLLSRMKAYPERKRQMEQVTTALSQVSDACSAQIDRLVPKKKWWQFRE